MNNPSTIVLVDDDAPTRAVMTHLLTLEGYLVLEAANGREALDIIGRERPSLVLSDVRMPVMGGEELVRTLRNNDGPPAILMTAHALVDAEAAARMGAVAVMHKPFEIDALLAVIDTVLREEVPPRRPEPLERGGAPHRVTE